MEGKQTLVCDNWRCIIFNVTLKCWFFLMMIVHHSQQVLNSNFPDCIIASFFLILCSYFTVYTGFQHEKCIIHLKFV